MRQVAVKDLAAMCARAAAPVLLDVREPWEVELAAIRIEGAGIQHIPMGEIAGRLDELNAAQTVVCICHHGMRSAQVVAFLQQQGHETVYNLAGGIDAWSVRVDPRVPRY